MLDGADNSNGELPSYIIGANSHAEVEAKGNVLGGTAV